MTEKSSFEIADQRVRLLRRMRDLAFLLPTIGVVFFLTPIINIFTSDGESPFLTPLLLYIFGIWALLILGALLISRQLAEETGQE